MSSACCWSSQASSSKLSTSTLIRVAVNLLRYQSAGAAGADSFLPARLSMSAPGQVEAQIRLYPIHDL